MSILHSKSLFKLVTFGRFEGGKHKILSEYIEPAKDFARANEGKVIMSTYETVTVEHAIDTEWMVKAYWEGVLIPTIYNHFITEEKIKISMTELKTWLLSRFASREFKLRSRRCFCYADFYDLDHANKLQFCARVLMMCVDELGIYPQTYENFMQQTKNEKWSSE